MTGHQYYERILTRGLGVARMNVWEQLAKLCGEEPYHLETNRVVNTDGFSGTTFTIKHYDRTIAIFTWWHGYQHVLTVGTRPDEAGQHHRFFQQFCNYLETHGIRIDLSSSVPA